MPKSKSDKKGEDSFPVVIPTWFCLYHVVLMCHEFSFLVSLTKTAKKGLKAKQHLVEEIRNSIDKYKFIYVFTTPNMRNSQLKSIRADMKSDSRY